MASLHSLPIIFIFISLVLCFFSSHSIKANEDLLKLACKDPACFDMLKKNKEIMIAKKEVDLGLAIIKSAIAQTKTTHEYILKKKAENPAYAFCEKAWLDMVPSFEMCLKNVEKNKGYKYDTDDYDLHNVGETTGECARSLTEKNKIIIDPEIQKGGDIVMALIASANDVLNHEKLKREGQI